MPTDETGYWKRVEKAAGVRIPSEVRRFFEQAGLMDPYSPTPEEDLDWLAEAVRCLRASGCYPQGKADPELIAGVPDDDRWQLLADLGHAFDVKFSGLPVTDEYHGLRPLTAKRYEDSSSYPPSQRLQIDFDSRMSLTTVVAILRREWAQRFKPQGWVRPTRQQGERALALVRFVCLESPDTASWRERMDDWNTRHPHWAFRDVRAFQGAFRRAETQLTGQRAALLPLYTTKAAYHERDRKWRDAHRARIRELKRVSEEPRQPGASE